MAYFRDTIEKMDGYTPGFQPKDADAVKLNTNENPYPPSPMVTDAIRSVRDYQLRRYPDPMGGVFRQAAAEVLDVPAEWVLCVNGGDELLSMAFRAICDGDRPAAWAEPTYSLYPVLARICGCEAITVGRDSDWVGDLADINAALTIVCNPNAPTCEFTGVDKIASLAKRLSGIMLVDEAYVDFAEDNCLRLVREYPNVIVLRSMSKGYSLAGLRAGFGVARPGIIEGLLKVKDSYNVDAVAIEAAAAALRDRRYHKECVGKIKTERQRLRLTLMEIGFDVPDSGTNFLLARSAKQNAEAVFDELVKRGIYVRYFRLDGLQDKLRITVGTAEQNDRLLSALREITG